VSPQFDIVVIGGGIHGVGVAQAAAAAGYSVLLIERDAIAAHTSRRSSKLIHGGLRYLETAQFGLVRESLRERATLLRIAPHLVRLVPFYIPVYVSTRRRPWQIRAGLSLYALLGSLGVDNRFITVPRGQWSFLDGLRTEGLEAVFRYYDAQTDDALLAEAVWRSAQALGAERACPAEFLGAERADDGYSIRYLADGEEQTCSAGALVNATGAWANETLKHISPAPPPQAVELVQGTHIVLPSTVAQGIYYVEAPIDRRAVFVMPWQDKTLVGTTETAYHGDPAAVAPLEAEIDYLRATYRHYFGRRPDEVLESWAGLRVLPQGEGAHFHRRRETVLYCAPEHPRLVSVYGGKLTGYRATGQRVVASLAKFLPSRNPRANTAFQMLAD
jgi:glycerol-3-phosphate dehydrogenase